MPYELQENSRDFRMEGSFKMPSPLRFDLTDGVRVHTEFEISQDTPNCITAVMHFVIEGSQWGLSAIDDNGMRTHEEAGKLSLININAAELTIEYMRDDRLMAIQKINEWIDKNHMAVYNRHVSKRLMLSIIK